MRPKYYAVLIIALLAVVIMLNSVAEYPASAKTMRIIVKDGYLELYGEKDAPGWAPARGFYEVMAPMEDTSLKERFYVHGYAVVKNEDGLVIDVNYGSLAPEKLATLIFLAAASSFLLGFSVMYLSSNWGEVLREWARVRVHVLVLVAGHYTALTLTILGVEVLGLLSEGNFLYVRRRPLLFYPLDEFVLASFLTGVYSLLILGRRTHRLIYYAARASLFIAALLFTVDGVHDALMFCKVDILGWLLHSTPGFIVFTATFIAYTAYKMIREEELPLSR